MTCLRMILGLIALVAGAAQATDTLPSSDQLAKSLARHLAKPLPSIEALVGVTMPPPSPLMVVASLGDDAALPDLDRGFAVGLTLNDLLFDADPRLDVVAPWYYAYDTRAKDAPRGQKRDSASNAYRAGLRDGAAWCTHGRVTGAAPTRVELVVDRCAPDKAAPRRTWTVRGDAEWPATLMSMCEFASAAATGELTARAKSSCKRAGDIRPASLLALARYGGPKENRAWNSLEALLAADPQFAPAGVEYLTFVRYTGDWNGHWNRIGAVAQAIPQSSAVQLIGFSRLGQTYGWKIANKPYPGFFAWVRDHSHLYAAWLELASSLAAGTPSDWPKDKASAIPLLDWAPFPWRKEPYTPNEATHTAALALSLAVYGNWPGSYRSKWQLGYSLMRYGWMLRGTSLWSDVPQSGKVGFPVFIRWADRFNDEALRAHPEADTVLINKMNTTKLRDGDWLAVFDRAVEVNRNNQRLYEDAINFSLKQWGGTAETRDRIFELALQNNPNAEWALTLRERMRKKYGQPDL